MRWTLARDAVWTPWKNGGGVTRQIAAYPEDAGLDDFGWRISTARVESEGPFSHFAGIDRTLAIVEGQLQFAQEGQALRTVGVNDAPLVFAGEAAVTAAPLGGSVLDFNLMTRRGRWRSGLAMQLLRGSEAVTIDAPAKGWIFVYVAAGNSAFEVGEPETLLQAADGMLLAPGDAGIRLRSQSGCRLLVATLLPAG